jgi:protein-L-isoaspartate(D-aspartate) O-methyltransferase
MTRRLLLSVLLCSAVSEAGMLDPIYDKARKGMVEEVRKEVQETAAYLGRGELAPSVTDAMAKVPRHAFVPLAYRLHAYANRPLPIGHGQTISQPYIVAVMTDLVDLEPGDRVLEIGTGSGYQAAVLAEIAKEVYTVEVIPELARSAKERFKALGYENIESRIGDGYYGWKQHAPFDAIVVTAAAGHIPPPLIEQLRPGGRMIMPVRGYLFTQYLILVTKGPSGGVTSRQILPVRFVPLTGGH